MESTIKIEAEENGENKVVNVFLEGELIQRFTVSRGTDEREATISMLKETKEFYKQLLSTVLIMNYEEVMHARETLEKVEKALRKLKEE